ncbi:MAG TPA: AsmA family protein [Candidatus Krumholzibacteria bacterium]
MKKKILIIVGAVVAVFAIVLVIVAANLNKIINSRKGELLAKAKAQTGRDITVGDVGVTFWPGIGASVADVVVSEDPAFGTEPFVRAKQVVVNVKLLPLLQKRVEVKRLILDEPNIIVIKQDAKTFNFTSMVAAASPPSATGAAKPKNSSMAAALAFADIKNGTLRYVDRVKATDRTIRDIDFTASNVGIGKKLDAKLDAAVFGEKQDVHLDAEAGPIPAPGNKEAMRAMPLDVTFELDPVAVATLMAATAKPGQPAPQPIPGDVQGKAKLTGTMGEANLEELNVEAALLGAKEPNVKLSASGGPFDFTADSTHVIARAKLKGKLETEPIALAEFKPKSKDPKTPPPVYGGDMRANATFDGDLTALAFEGAIDATNASIAQSGPDGKPTFVKKAGIPAKATVHGTFRPEKTPGEGVDMEKIDIVFHSLTANGSGRMVPFTGRKALELTLDAKTPLKPWNELLPAMAPFALSGDATANVHVSGMPAPNAPAQITGTAYLKNVGARVEQMPKPVSDGEAKVVFTTKTANIDDAKFRIGDSRFFLDLAVMSFKPMQAHYTVSSEEVKRLDVQAPAPGAKPFPRPEVFKRVDATGTMKETAPKVTENTVIVTSERGTVANIDYDNLTADLTVTPTVTTIKSYSAKALGGTLSGSGTMEPKISKFNISSKIENVNLAEYFKYKAPALTDVLAGRLTADLKIGGQGKQWEEIAKSLTGDGDALVIEGSLLNMNIANQIFAGIQNIPMVPQNLTARMQARNPKLFASNKTVFENLSSKFKIANGKITVPDLKLATSDFALNGDGWFSLTKEMNVSSVLAFSKGVSNDLVAEVPAAKYLLTPDGRLEVPLTLSGALMKPTVGVDTQAMTMKFQQGMVSQGQKQVEEKAKSGLKGLLDNLGKKKQPAPKDTTATPADTTSRR